jgi:hypothetical protein
MITTLTRIYVFLIAAVCLFSLIYVYVIPPPSLKLTREGVPFFTPPVAHPETGEPLDLRDLVRHFRGD